MTDPTSANKVLVALAERASKRRSQLKREEINNNEQESDIGKEQTKFIQEDYSVQEEKNSNFRPKKNIQVLREEKEVSLEEETAERIAEPEEAFVTVKRPRERTLVRKPKKISRLSNSINPENAETFEEQVELVGNLLYNKLLVYQSISALRVTQEWIDCIVDENDSFYEDVYNKLSLLDKDQLLGYIRILVSALK